MNWWDVPLPDISTARYHRKEIDQILQCVQDGVYCAVLGPRLSGKTELLHYVAQVLLESFGWTCIYVDLSDLRSFSQQGFFSELARQVGSRFSELTGIGLPGPDEDSISSAVFRAFLIDCNIALGQDFVLIIEHLEALPTDLVQALLTSLRAAYMDQQTQDQRVTVVVSGALSLATLTVGESSPFRGIARRVFINDLSQSESQELISEHLQNAGIEITNTARHHLLDATRGDPFLIRWLCERGIELANASNPVRLKSAHIQRAMNEFLRQEVFHYMPLLEAVRLIEEDPDLLHCTQKLLEHEYVPKTELPLPLSPDLDPLYLTGVVEIIDENCYRLQNQIYRRFLSHHFVPGRVGQILAMTGRWDQALDQLEIAVNLGDLQSRAELLPAIINSIYAAQDIRDAAHFISRGLAAAFNVTHANIWYAPPQENRLRLVQHIDPGGNGEAWANPEILISADRLEARAYRSASIMRGQETGGRVLRAIPLTIPGHPPVGVVSLWDELAQDRFIEQSERDWPLVGFLRQAARALFSVSLRRQELILAGRLQASLLPDSPPEHPGWQFSSFWRPARETAGDFFDFIDLPDKHLGVVIADVVDKGMGAALYMALSRTLIRLFAADFPMQPEKVLQAVNTRMLADADIGHFVTTFYAVIDLNLGEIVYCNAGHNPPILFQEGSPGTALRLAKTGPALGVMGGEQWQPARAQLALGSTLILYTDGLLDAQNHHDQDFGYDRITEILASLDKPSAEDIQDALVSGVRAFVGDEPQFDDLTILIALREARVQAKG